MHHALLPADAIFAFGTHDLAVVDRAIDLYLEGYGQYLICAGNSGSTYGKKHLFPKPEAEMYADIAVARGVPPDRIIVENKSTNTGENISFVRKILEERNIVINSVILVQKPYMERRLYATVQKQWPEVHAVVTSQDISYEAYKELEVNKEIHFIDVMVGDLQRIIDYPKLGLQIAQDIPDEVLHAYKRLVELGFSKYLIQV
jgi:uncharacterized SAM-binding protein YcdF (DUF218 family)